MKSAGIFLLSLTMAVVLSGCDIADRIPLTPRDAAEAARPFGTPTREKLEETEEGTRYRWTLESRRPATWSQALSTIRRTRENRCPDGQFADDLDFKPALDKSTTASYTHEYPAGTLFIMEQRCPAPPSYQFTFDKQLDTAEATRLVEQRIQERAGGRRVSTVVIPFHAKPEMPLFEQVRMTLAAFAQGQAETCPDAFRFSYMSLGVQPSPDDDEQTPDAYLGFITDCLDGAKSAPWPVPEAES